MKSIELSKYQEDILNSITYERDNLLINAKAGSGKTTVLLLIAELLEKQNTNCIFLAFNNSTVKDISNKVSNLNNCKVSTIHSLGLTFLRSYFYKKYNKDYDLEVDTNNTYVKEIVTKEYEKYCNEGVEAYCNAIEMNESEKYNFKKDLINDFVNVIKGIKIYMLDYKEFNDIDYAVNTRTNTLKNHLDIIPYYYRVIQGIMEQIIYRFDHFEEENGKFKVSVNFDDFLYFPVIKKMQIPYSIKDNIEMILVDEAQDLSVLQQSFLKLLITRDNRFVFVGDEKQSIYAFNGADCNSIPNLKRNFRLKELPLNICYRCPENILKLAKEIVPDIEWNFNRKDKGKVYHIEHKDIYNKVKANDIILCRYNRDILSIFRQFMKRNKLIKFIDETQIKEMINGIDNAIKDYILRYNTGANIDIKLKDEINEYSKLLDTTNEKKDYLLKEKYKELYKKYSKELIDKKKKNGKISKSNYTIDYLKTCMEEYKENGTYKIDLEDDNLTDNLAYYDTIMSLIDDEIKKKNKKLSVEDFKKTINEYLTSTLQTKDVPILSTVHKMKGGEANNIFIIDYDKFPYTSNKQTIEEQQQEENLKYVALTRAKNNLYLVNSTPKTTK